jgi:hypothetical protein
MDLFKCTEYSQRCTTEMINKCYGMHGLEEKLPRRQVTVKTYIDSSVARQTCWKSDSDKQLVDAC